ncbi:hypothetical protein AWU65_03395 [Paenibacillus glucanolyticus]|uniref:Isoprenylcysteine carboxyl methyltransferase n=1 Tax=Paenibacillus glucanolyticus TaxID=59843 RepID=A0A163GM45_9BACL|nr:hypothetical protein AWU65_03395 [Paenibacillus glucanolyticus]OMF66723.1 hypothetical protein BK142_29320 [Paenibacillus glucanolyticus]
MLNENSFIAILSLSILILITLIGLKKISQRSTAKWSDFVLLLLLILFYCVIFWIKPVLFWFNSHILLGLLISLNLIYLIHYLSICILSKNWTDSEKPKENGSLIIKGMYRFVRHPIYSMFFFEGFVFMLISPWLLPIALCAMGVPFYRLIRLREEDYLIDKFGKEYQDYKERVKYRIIPYVW